MSRRPDRGRLGRTVAAGAAVLLAVPVVLLGAVTAGLAGLPADAQPSAFASADIPADLLGLYQQPAAGCPGLPWPVLAGIGKVESDHDRPPGQVSSAGARGPMQLLPATWNAYGGDGNADGRIDPFDPADAIPAAAAYLCALGAARDLTAAVATYRCGEQRECTDHSRGSGGYAAQVLRWATRYTDPAGPAGPAATRAVQVALAQVGTPYLWGGETPGLGFDCSGLVQHAYSAAGLALPRTAQSQFDAGPRLPPDQAPQLGDLVFFGTGPSRVTHVGIALGDGRMVDAPHTGALVRVEPIAGFGRYLGGTRPTTGAAT
jgi:cell wall-associated NlpC family hydrolase